MCWNPRWFFVYQYRDLITEHSLLTALLQVFVKQNQMGQDLRLRVMRWRTSLMTTLFYNYYDLDRSADLHQLVISCSERGIPSLSFVGVGKAYIIWHLWTFWINFRTFRFLPICVCVFFLTIRGLLFKTVTIWLYKTWQNYPMYHFLSNGENSTMLLLSIKISSARWRFKIQSGSHLKCLIRNII